MRLIDADKLWKVIKCSNLNFFANGKIIEYLRNIIDEQPTIKKENCK